VSDDDGAARTEAPASTGAGTEKYKQRAVLLRVLIYVFATHLFAGFVILLFYLGGHAQK
jgi:hypothetical protein